MSFRDGKKTVKTYIGVSLKLFYSFILELAFDYEMEFLQKDNTL